MKTQLTYTAADPELCARLCQALGCHPVLAALLVKRGISSPQEARFFLDPNFDRLTDPFALEGMGRACDRILEAVVNKEKILIFGDFDADGVTAAAMVSEFLGLVEADVSWYVPHRTKEGYSLQEPQIEMAAEMDVDLIITVDCGITSHGAAQRARQEDIDLIVTDHHEPSDTLPPALAVVNPKQPGCNAGLDFLAGVGVAFFLVMALRKHFRDHGVWERYPEPNLTQFLDLFAIGTIGDMVPLVHENRVLCLAGLRQIKLGTRPGIQTLAQAARLDLNGLDSDDISYKLVPRINAAGRMSHARICVSHLTAASLAQARPTADLLEQLNLKRQQIEREIVAQIEGRIAKDPTILDRRILVLWDRTWDPSVLGIAASRLSRKYVCPVILLHLKDEMAQGSCRSINQINIHQALTAHAHLLERFGGHAMAAGLALKKDRLEPLSSGLAAYMEAHYTKKDFRLALTVDAELDLSEVTPDLARQIDRLRPFGTANPEPLFISRQVRVASSTVIGTCHRKMTLQSDGTGAMVEAMQFNLEDLRDLPTYFDQIAFRLKINKFKANTPQLIIEDF